MDGRAVTILVAFVLPAILIAVTIARFASNPVALLALIGTMIVGGLYLLTYRESFGA